MTQAATSEPPSTAAAATASSATPTESATATIFRELTDFSRRAGVRSRQALPDLAFGAYALLRHIESVGGCRAADLAGHFGLEKSTVSRQVGDLIRADLITASADPSDSRARRLSLTSTGIAQLQQADEIFLAAMAERMADWSEAERESFAGLLVRFNAGSGRQLA